MIQLKKIDLKRSIETGDGGYTHPDVHLRSAWYLAKIGNTIYNGRFGIEQYGLYFDGLTDTMYSSLQFDPYGINGPKWEELYEIVQK